MNRKPRTFIVHGSSNVTIKQLTAPMRKTEAPYRDVFAGNLSRDFALNHSKKVSLLNNSLEHVDGY